MKNDIQTVAALRMIIMRDRLARDEESIQLIFKIFEESGISCECLTIHIDCLTAVVRDLEYEKCSRCLDILMRKLNQTSVSIDRDIMLLCMEKVQITCREVGMIVNSLIMQNIEIKMHRYLQCRGHFIIGVPMNMVERAKAIITELMDADYRI